MRRLSGAFDRRDSMSEICVGDMRRELTEGNFEQVGFSIDFHHFATVLRLIWVYFDEQLNVIECMRAIIRARTGAVRSILMIEQSRFS